MALKPLKSRIIIDELVKSQKRVYLFEITLKISKISLD